MSKHHVNCTKPTEANPVKSKKHRNREKQLTLKPFCDCRQCLCDNCPDILKIFSITVTEKSCDFGPKVTKDKSHTSKKPDVDSDEIANLLNIIENDKDCNCEVASKALRSNLHKNIGLPERNGTVISIQEPEVPTKNIK